MLNSWTSLLIFSLGFGLYLGWRAWREGTTLGRALSAFFRPPRLADEEQGRQARLLTGILAAVMAVTFALGLAVTALSLNSYPWVQLFLLSALAGLQGLVRRGAVRAASWLLLTMMLLTATSVLYFEGALANAVVSGYVVVIAAASLLLGGRGTLLFTLLSILALGALFYFQSGAAPAEPQIASAQPLREWTIYAGILSMMALLQYLAVRSIRQGLRHIQLLLAAERKRAHQLQLLTTIAHRLTGHADARSLLDDAVLQVHQELGFEHVSLLLVEGEALTTQAAAGAFAAQAPPGSRLALGQGLAGWVAQQGRPVLANNLAQETRFAPLHGAPLAAGAAVPLRLGKNVIGVLDVGSARAGVFDATDLTTLESLADLVAAGLQSSQLLEELRRRERMAEALRRLGAAVAASLDLPTVLDTACVEARNAFEAQAAAIWLLDVDHNSLRAAAADGPGMHDLLGLLQPLEDAVPLVTRAFHERQPLLAGEPDPAVFRHFPQARTLLATPILRDELPMGVLAIADSRQDVRFKRADLDAAQRLGQQVANAIYNARLHTHTEKLAATDGLTGLSNRRFFDGALVAEVARARRYSYPLSLLLLDMDNFKEYNDTYGHPAGDERLRTIAHLLRSQVRDPDMVARYGGEEFVVILPHTDRTGALILAERVRAAAEVAAPAPPQAGAPVSGHTVSIGVATFPTDAHTPETLLVAADQAELAAKRQGKNRVVTASDNLPHPISPPA